MANGNLPPYLSLKPEQIGLGTPVALRVLPSAEALAEHMAQAMLDVIQRTARQGRAATLIVPVGPVDQFPILAQYINDRQVDCRHVVLINMDEYLTSEDAWIDVDHPLSFRGYMDRKFYDLIHPELAPLNEHRVFPDPRRTEAIGRLIEARGGVDACFGGIGINGHMAFNEPPEPGQEMHVERYASLPTRALSLSRETRTINSVTVGGELQIIPHRAVTVGMREILAARELRFYCNRPWQRAVIRRVLHGPLTAACPASLLRTHSNAELTVARYVAELPEIRLR